MNEMDARTLGRIEGKVDMLIDMHQEDRLRIAAVEKKVWYGTGVAAVVALIAAKLGIPLPHGLT